MRAGPLQSVLSYRSNVSSKSELAKKSPFHRAEYDHLTTDYAAPQPQRRRSRTRHLPPPQHRSSARLPFRQRFRWRLLRPSSVLVVPHAPQLDTSVNGLAQRPPHLIVPGGQAHTPTMHAVPIAHLWLHAPQLAASVRVFVHDAPQSVCPAPHTVPVAPIRQGTASSGHDVVWRTSPVAGISTLSTVMPETMLQPLEYSWSERSQLPSP